jgi:FKBP-type peptidyl-prolyl cis-trans isomerase SlpA
MANVQAGSHITLHYRMALVDRGVERELVNTFASAPATLQMGVGQWSPSIEARLLGLGEGDRLDLALEPADAYGPRLPELVRGEGTLAVGQAVEVQDARGVPLHGVVAAWDDANALIDFNHPLAGKTLHVRVEVVGVL